MYSIQASTFICLRWHTPSFVIGYYETVILLYVQSINYAFQVYIAYSCIKSKFHSYNVYQVGIFHEEVITQQETCIFEELLGFFSGHPQRENFLALLHIRPSFRQSVKSSSQGPLRGGEVEEETFKTSMDQGALYCPWRGSLR